MACVVSSVLDMALIISPKAFFFAASDTSSFLQVFAKFSSSALTATHWSPNVSFFARSLSQVDVAILATSLVIVSCAPRRV